MTAPSVREALERRIADLMLANDKLSELDCDTSRDQARNQREIEWLNRIIDPDGDYPAEDHSLSETWQAEARGEFSTLATPPTPTPSGARERIARHNRVIALEFCKGSFQKRLGLTNERTLVYADVIAELIDQATDYALALLPAAAAIRAAAFEEAALTDVAAERKRQRDVEGWTAEHDDGHNKGELAAAAACYAVGRCILEGSLRITERGLTKNLWPWSSGWWKPKDRRRNLVRAAALIVAEIERIDRAAAVNAGGVK